MVSVFHGSTILQSGAYANEIKFAGGGKGAQMQCEKISMYKRFPNPSHCHSRHVYTLICMIQIEKVIKGHEKIVNKNVNLFLVSKTLILVIQLKLEYFYYQIHHDKLIVKGP